MDLDGDGNILWINHIANNGIQSSEREQQAQIYQMKAICFMLSAYQNRFQFTFRAAEERGQRR